MKQSVISAIIIMLVLAGHGCKKGNYGQVISDETAAKYSLRGQILMVTKKRCPGTPATFEELVRCVEKESRAESGYGATYIREFSGVSNQGTLKGAGKDIAFYYEFLFNADEAGKWAFEFAIDAGVASGCRIDGKELWFSREDTWSLGDYSRAFVRETELTRGIHKFELYGIENCCDGVWRLRYKSPSMTDFAVVPNQRLQVRSRHYSR